MPSPLIRAGQSVLSAAGLLMALAAPAAALPLFQESFDAPLADQPGIEQLAVAPIGTDACKRFTEGTSRASGSALCGSGTANKGGVPDPFDRLVFSDPGFAGALRIDVSLAAFEFGILDGPQSSNNPDLFDYILISAGNTVVARFDGDDDTFALTQTAGRYTGPDKMTRGEFEDYAFFVGQQSDGLARDLTIDVKLTGTTEFAGIDALSVQAIPSPTTLLMLAIGLSLAAAAGVRKRLV